MEREEGKGRSARQETGDEVALSNLGCSGRPMAEDGKDSRGRRGTLIIRVSNASTIVD